MFIRLSREDAHWYIDQLKDQGFNIIQVFTQKGQKDWGVWIMDSDVNNRRWMEAGQ